MYTGRVGFISYVSGERFAFAGPSQAENQWTVPCKAFHAQDIVGHFLVKLKPSAAVNGFELARDSDGQVILSSTVQGFVSPKNEIVKYGPLWVLHDDDGLVPVMFGDVQCAYEDVPCCSLSDISTPRSIMSN
jgi:hypothetical protein